jgi:hypothetical protein
MEYIDILCRIVLENPHLEAKIGGKRIILKWILEKKLLGYQMDITR